MNYTIYVRTRSWRGDYRWLGIAPVEWWKAHSTGGLVVNTTGVLRNGSQIILTGIIGERQDFAGTPIRYDIAVEPDSNGALTEDDVRALLAEFWASRSGSRLGTAFDQALGADGNANIDGDSSAVVAAITDAIRNLPRAPARKPDQPLSWIGAEDPGALNVLLDSNDVLYSALLNAEVRDELLTSSMAPKLIVEGESGQGARVSPPTMAERTTPTASGGCLISVIAVAGVLAIKLRRP